MTSGWADSGAKRLLDLLLVLPALALLAPVMLIVSVLVALRLGRPVLFRQQRSGRHGRPFEILKFRSMTDARDASGELLPDTERLTPFGRWLRSTSLDELPELLNILRGEMSLVGPRPLLTEYDARYDARQRRRLEVRPGLTGLSQTRGRNALDWQTRLELDACYVESASPWLDLRLLFETIGVVLRRQGIQGEGSETMTRFTGTGPAAPEDAPVSTGSDPTAAHTDTAESPAEAERWPFHEPDEIAAATAVLASGRVNYWTGEEARAFEREFARMCGVGHAVACANGTLALELALRALDVGPGDEVIVTPRSFVASAGCVRWVGATPVFADIESDSQNLDPAAVERLLSPRTRAVIVVHLAGWPADVPALMRLAQRHDFAVIEDCAQAHGAALDGRRVGGLGHLATFSFCQDKIISTGGEGGMLVTDDAELAERAWSLKDHGKSRALLSAPPGPNYRFVHAAAGSNWRLTEFQAAIGRVQLQRLDAMVDARRSIASRLLDAFEAAGGFEVARPRPGIRHAAYRAYVLLDPGGPHQRADVLERLRAAGVPCGSGACPELYREGVFADLPTPACPVAVDVGERSIMVALHHRLRPATIDAWVEAIRALSGSAPGSAPAHVQVGPSS